MNTIQMLPRHSANLDQVNALDDTASALQTLTMLLDGEAAIDAQGRDSLAGLMSLLLRLPTADADQAGKVHGALRALSDLLLPERDMHIVGRDNMAALLTLLTQLQCDALATLRAGLVRESDYAAAIASRIGGVPGGNGGALTRRSRGDAFDGPARPRDPDLFGRSSAAMN